MNDLDKQYKSLKGDHGSDMRAVLLSSLPDIAMAKKLISRKQNGKKKFSDDFDFDGTMHFIDMGEKSIYNQLQSGKIMVQDDISYFTSLHDICLKAKDEIRMESLKGDFEYLSESFMNCGEFLKTQGKEEDN